VLQLYTHSCLAVVYLEQQTTSQLHNYYITTSAPFAFNARLQLKRNASINPLILILIAATHGRGSVCRPCERDNLVGILKQQSNGPLYSNTVIGTLAVDGWAVTFGTAIEEGHGRAASTHCIILLYLFSLLILFLRLLYFMVNYIC